MISFFALLAGVRLFFRIALGRRLCFFAILALTFLFSPLIVSSVTLWISVSFPLSPSWVWVSPPQICSSHKQQSHATSSWSPPHRHSSHLTRTHPTQELTACESTSNLNSQGRPPCFHCADLPCLLIHRITISRELCLDIEGQCLFLR